MDMGQQCSSRLCSCKALDPFAEMQPLDSPVQGSHHTYFALTERTCKALGRGVDLTGLTAGSDKFL